ncbi:MAG: hypothetical protein D6805_07115 [Planctomycetota bacterium]|nr:MAG: hypothetical protein D6805_07115 [Planctomycetota bacterium]
MSSQEYDFVVLGGGSAGSAAAAEAVKLGVGRVALINEEELGGLCILRGCMPTKTLLFSAEFLLHARDCREVGVDLSQVRYNFSTIMERKRRLVQRFQSAKIAAMKRGGYSILFGQGRFTSPQTIRVGERNITFRTCQISTGSTHAIPPIEGLSKIDYLTSDDVLELKAPPASLTIQGAGPVALEFATFFAALGTKVFLLNRSPILNQGEDPDLSNQYKNMLEHHGINVYAPAKTLRISSTPAGKVQSLVEVQQRKFLVETEKFLVATGRIPHISHLNLEAANVQHQKGKILLNEYLQTTNPRIFAAGDASGNRLILHTANQKGRLVAKNVKAFLNDQPLFPWREEIPITVIFTDHPYAEVGLRQKQAQQAGYSVVVAQKNWANQGRGIVMNTRPEEGFIKIIACQKSAKILGAQILGPRADDLIHTLASTMYYGGTAYDLLNMPWYHPTLSEAFVELAREIVSQCT